MLFPKRNYTDATPVPPLVPTPARGLARLAYRRAQEKAGEGHVAAQKTGYELASPFFTWLVRPVFSFVNKRLRNSQSPINPKKSGSQISDLAITRLSKVG
jgi:hypothetical protein